MQQTPRRRKQVTLTIYFRSYYIILEAEIQADNIIDDQSIGKFTDEFFKDLANKKGELIFSKLKYDDYMYELYAHKVSEGYIDTYYNLVVCAPGVLKDSDDVIHEYRVFYIDGEIGTVSRNSGQGDHAPMPPKELLEKYRSLGSPIYTVDYAELSDGSWKVIEAGDGQVSGLSDHQDYKAFFRVVSIALSERYLPDEILAPGT